MLHLLASCYFIKLLWELNMCRVLRICLARCTLVVRIIINTTASPLTTTTTTTSCPAVLVCPPLLPLGFLGVFYSFPHPPT